MIKCFSFHVAWYKDGVKEIGQWAHFQQSAAKSILWCSSKWPYPLSMAFAWCLSQYQLSGGRNVSPWLWYLGWLWQLPICVCEHPYPAMAFLDHRSPPQGRNSELPGVTASEKPSLAGTSICVWMLCLCLAPTLAQETFALGMSALLFGSPWGCVWAHRRLQPQYEQLMSRFC